MMLRGWANGEKGAAKRSVFRAPSEPSRMNCSPEDSSKMCSFSRPMIIIAANMTKNSKSKIRCSFYISAVGIFTHRGSMSIYKESIYQSSIYQQMSI